MEKDKHFLQEAIDISIENVKNGNGGPFGAVIVKDGKIIARGYNSVTHLHDPTAHAEVQAIREASRKLGTEDLSDCTIYSSCEPCPMCLGAIYWSRLKALHFAADKNDAARAGFDDAFIYKEIVKNIEARHIPTIQNPELNHNEAFQLWNQSDNKVEY